jgi:RNA polymerase sigma-70 factor (ECF subfamily)
MSAPSGAPDEGTTRLTRKAVACAKAGDPEGIHYLYVRYADDVLRYVGSFVRDPHEAEDITQNVFAKLIRAIHRYEEREVPFQAWVLRVARNAALDHLRAKRELPAEEVRIAAPDPGQTSSEYGQALRQALDELPEDQREVLVLRHIVGLSPGEIAGALHKTESSIHGLHHRGRRTLRASLTRMGVEPVVSRRPDA